ncbi:unnamed protein product [Linum tenue]|uniref:Uncharacterized protein n=1 Tax=Linum tenue TaxID=586396 RepID=A0AAV0QVE4_9ROSI|nr:unnamed protein product [Linum tenue]
MCTDNAFFHCSFRTVEPYPLVCEPYRVPFLLNLSCAAGFD